MPKSGVEGSHGDSISSFFENLQSFQSYLTSLHSQQQRGQVCLHIHPASVVICIPEDSHSDWSAMGSVSSLRCFFLEPEGAEHFFFFILRQRLTMYPWLAVTSWDLPAYALWAGLNGIHQHAPSRAF